jgi:predicted PurR-regulated permease PerM
VNELSASRALYRGFLFLLVIFIFALILHSLIGVLMQLFVASIIAAAMTPIANSIVNSKRVRGWRWQPPRGLVVVAVFLVAVLIGLVFGFLIVRAIAREIAALLENLPAYAAQLGDWLTAVGATNAALRELDVTSWIAANVQTVLGAVSGVLGGMAGVVNFTFGVLGGFLTVIFITFMALYLTVDAPRMRDYLVVFWPMDRQPQVSRIANEMGHRLGHWAIGQGVLCAIIGGGAWLGLQIIGVPYAALLGLIWALAEFVPGIGPFISAVPSIFLGFTVSPAVGVASAIFTLVWSQVENNIITPKVMGNAVELHPLVILIALLVGFELLGMAGGLLAIPVAATLAVIVDELRLERIRSQMAVSSDGTRLAEVVAPLAPDPVAQPS